MSEGGGPVVCYPTRLVTGKRIFDACEAVLSASTVLPGLRLRIAGDGPLRDALSKWVAMSGAGRVEMLGLLSYDQMLDLYATSDLLVFTGTRERYGMVIVEALAAGLPVVSYSRAGAARELVKHGSNGYLIEEGDIAELAACICRALDEGQYSTLRRNAACVVAEQDIRLKARQFAELIKSVVSGRARRATPSAVAV
jgi:glycosyltransferase involved in cell wall biosynthesis